jgi:hypothetical protein
MYTFNHLYELSLGRSYHVPSPDPRFPGLSASFPMAQKGGVLLPTLAGVCVGTGLWWMQQHVRSPCTSLLDAAR